MANVHIDVNAQSALNDIVNLTRYPLNEHNFRQQCQHQLSQNGVLVLADFLTADAIATITQAGKENEQLAYFCQQTHNVYLTPPDKSLAATHLQNRHVISSKGCITDDQIALNSPLRKLYNAREFRLFLCVVLAEHKLYPYADNLSSINLHYARAGEQLGWHFDNSSFAITLLIQKPAAGGVFEYITAARDADKGITNDMLINQALDGEINGKSLTMNAGTLVLFRGRNALHRVTSVTGSITRMLAVLAYNTEPNIALSKSAQTTFYGRVG